MDNKDFSTGDAGNSKDGDRALWDLLGKARESEASPMFSRNVVREIRLSGEKASGWQSLIDIFRKPALLAAATAVLVISGIIILQNQPGSTSVVEIQDPEVIDYIDPAEEFESIEMLGELMAVSDPGSLSDEAVMNLLF